MLSDNWSNIDNRSIQAIASRFAFKALINTRLLQNKNGIVTEKLYSWFIRSRRLRKNRIFRFLNEQADLVCIILKWSFIKLKKTLMGKVIAFKVYHFIF